MGAYSELDIALRNKYQYGIDEDAIDPATAAALLGGEIDGRWIRCPSPGVMPMTARCTSSLMGRAVYL